MARIQHCHWPGPAGRIWYSRVAVPLASCTLKRRSFSDGNTAFDNDVPLYPLIQVDVITTAGTGTHTFDVYAAIREN